VIAFGTDDGCVGVYHTYSNAYKITSAKHDSPVYTLQWRLQTDTVTDTDTDTDTGDWLFRWVGREKKESVCEGEESEECVCVLRERWWKGNIYVCACVCVCVCVAVVVVTFLPYRYHAT